MLMPTHRHCDSRVSVPPRFPFTFALQVSLDMSQDLSASHRPWLGLDERYGKPRVTNRIASVIILLGTYLNNKQRVYD